MAVKNGIVYFNNTYQYVTLHDLSCKYGVEPALIAGTLTAVGMLQDEYGHWRLYGEAVYKNDEIITPVLDTLEALTV